MTMTPSRGGHRTILVTAVAGALVVGTAGTVPAVGARAHDPRPGLLRSFATQTLDRTDPPGATHAAKGASASPSAKRAQPVARSTDAAPAAPAPSSRSLAATVDCAGLQIAVTQTANHTHLTWEPVAGATAFTVKRGRPGASAVTLAAGLPGTTTSYDDLVHNPLGQVAYRVEAVVAGTTTSCRTPETPDYFWTMNTVDGVGYPDVVFAGTDKVWEQDTFGPAAPAWSQAASRPAFSPTGRLVAAVEQVSGVWSITVRKASNGALQWSVPSPSGAMLDEPSFSPDGQRIVVEALDLADLTVSTGLYTMPVNTTTHPLTSVPNSLGLATADWVDTPGALTSTTIVAGDLATPGGLLTFINPTTGLRTPVPGTQGALDPMGRPDGSILFTTLSDTQATLDVRNADGSLRRIQSWAGSTTRWPVADPSTGNVLVYLREPDTSTPDVPNDFLWSVSMVDPDTGLNEPTGIGVPRSGDSVGFNGFDLRTPVSAGTSNFGGAANGDLLVRTSTGVLYAYPLSASTDRFFDTRRQLATGWGSMKKFVAAGDLNSDGQGDIAAVDGSGILWLYPGKGSFGLGARTRIGAGWSTYSIVAPGDLDGDTKADLVVKDGSGAVWLYPGTGRGGLAPRVQIASGWSTYTAILGPGDWNYDGKADLLARNSSGYLYLYPGKGNGKFSARVLLGTGWNARNGFATPEFWGSITTLFARTTTGTLLDYDSVGNGAISGNAIYQAATGWSTYTITG
jgi:hypothetical protein